MKQLFYKYSTDEMYCAVCETGPASCKVVFISLNNGNMVHTWDESESIGSVFEPEILVFYEEITREQFMAAFKEAKNGQKDGTEWLVFNGASNG